MSDPHDDEQLRPEVHSGRRSPIFEPPDWEAEARERKRQEREFAEAAERRQREREQEAERQAGHTHEDC